VEVLIFYVVLLGSCIWPDTISRLVRQKKPIKLYANIGKSATETPEMIRQVFGEESMSRTRVFERQAPFRQIEKSQAGAEQNQEHSHHFL
jgi:hypothetical protein